MGKFALLIGVGTYESSELQNLKAAIPDVRAIEKVLIDPAIAEFATIDVEILLDPEPQRMREAIERLFTDRKKDDLVLLYFSGHGEINDYGAFYFTSTITRRNRLASTAIPATFVHGLMEECKSQRQVMILDACYSGAFASGMRAKGGEVDLNAQFGGKGRAVLTSSSPVEQSFEHKERELSVYTQYIEEGLRTGIADRDEDGWISIDELHEFAREKVREVASAMQPKIYAVEEGYKIRFAKAPMKSIETVKKKTEEDSNSGLSYENFLSEGLNKYHLKDFKCAIENFNKVIEINQNFSYAYYIRGNSRSNLNDHKGAIEDFNKAIELNSNYANAYYNRGNCRGNLRDYQGAIDDFNRVIILNPDHANAYYRRGNYRGNLRDYKRAIKDYTKAIELKPDFANAYNNRAVSRKALSENNKAIADYKKAVDLYPVDNPWRQKALDAIKELQ